MKVNIIAAVAENGVIGYQGKLPWHIPEDLKRFKELTTSHAVIMGKNTWYSLPIKPLSNRLNCIISSNLKFRYQLVKKNSELLAISNLRLAIESIKNREFEECFIIGGTRLYHESLDLDVVDTMYLTFLHDRYEGDTYFPEIDFSQWKEVEREDFEGYSFVKYDRLHHA